MEKIYCVAQGISYIDILISDKPITEKVVKNYLGLLDDDLTNPETGEIGDIMDSVHDIEDLAAFFFEHGTNYPIHII